MTTMNFEKPEQDEGLTLESHAIDRFASPDEEPIPHTEPCIPCATRPLPAWRMTLETTSSTHRSGRHPTIDRSTCSHIQARPKRSAVPHNPSAGLAT